MPALISFQEIKRRVPLEAVLRQYGLWETLAPRGKGSLAGPCPLHEGSHPTQFKVTPEKNCWKCFGCGQGGNMLDFVAALEGLTIREAALRVEGWFPSSQPTPARESPATRPGTVRRRDYRTSDNGLNEPPSRKVPSEEDSEPHRNPPLSFPGLRHLDPRHPALATLPFSATTLEAFGAGYCGKGLHAGRLAIPIHNRAGERLAYAGYSLEDEGLIYPPGFRKDWELFNIHRALAARREGPEPVLVAECLDVFRLFEAGCPTGLALLGDSISEEQVGLLLEAFGERARLTLFGPRQGEFLPVIAARLLPLFYVRIVWPEGERLRPQDLSVGEVWEILRL
jgi:DNA primase